MAAPAVVQAEPAPQTEEPQESFFSRTFQMFGYIFLAMTFTNLVVNFMLPETAKSNVASTPGPGDNPAASATSTGPAQVATPIWTDDLRLDLQIYVSSSGLMASPATNADLHLAATVPGFHFGNFSDRRIVETMIPIPHRDTRIRSLWAHYVVGRSGSDWTDPANVYQLTRPLTVNKRRRIAHEKRNLLTDQPSARAASEADLPLQPIVPHYHPNLTLSFVPHYGEIPTDKPNVFTPHIAWNSAAPPDGYYPVLFHNTFWQLLDDMQELNDTTTVLPLRLTVENLSWLKFAATAMMAEASRQALQNSLQPSTGIGGSNGNELEMIKEVFLNGNPILLTLTAIASVLHMIFEMLAFGSEVSDWRKKKNSIGVSVRTIIANVIMKVIVFLYLFDNNDNVSFVIIFSQLADIGLEGWKVTKVVDVRIRPSAGIFPYSIEFEDKHELDEGEKKTQEYDKIAFKYVYISSVPLILAYAIYSLVNDSHKSWYSFIITTLVGSVYSYEFLMMLPSLYINYRLKSVAHMPAKSMIYKCLNTFIDDLFAFAVKMPLLHRISKFRDDVVFFIYLYQRWIYRVDHGRVNEFGQGGGDEPVVEDKNMIEGGKPSDGEETAEDGIESSAETTGIDDAAGKGLKKRVVTSQPAS